LVQKVHGSLRKVFDNASFTLDGPQSGGEYLGSVFLRESVCPPRLRRKFNSRSPMSCS